MVWCLIKQGVHFHGVLLGFPLLKSPGLDPNLCNFSVLSVYVKNLRWADLPSRVLPKRLNGFIVSEDNSHSEQAGRPNLLNVQASLNNNNHT